jgi:hypothetical protein
MKTNSKNLRKWIGATTALLLAAALCRWGGPMMIQEGAEVAGSNATRHQDIKAAVETAAAGQAQAFAVTAAPASPSQLRPAVAISPDGNAMDFVGRIAGTNIPAAVRFLHEFGLAETNRALSIELVRRWTELEPRVAADWMAKNATNSARLEELVAVATVWAGQSPRDAAQWARELADPAERHGTLPAVGYEMARSAPREALALAEELPAGMTRDELSLHAAVQWAAQDPRAAATWTAQMTSGPLREQALSGIARIWAGGDPMAAATMALEKLPAGRAQEDAVVGIVQQWAQKEPAHAAAWVMTFPEGAAGQAALENLVSLWADQDIEQTSEWLATLEPGAKFDSAIAVFSGKLAVRFPEIAAEWAAHIGDAALRQLRMESVAEVWMQTDAIAAREWIAATPFHDTTKSRLLALKADDGGEE